MILGIEHTAIASTDIAALAAWYERVLGFKIVYQSPNAIFVSTKDGSMLELIHADVPRGEQTMKTQGIRHLALTVADFDASYAMLQQHGVSFVTDPMESKGNRVVFFSDPEGNYLHLLHRAHPLY